MKILLIEDSPEIVKGVTLTFKLRWQDATVIAFDEGAKGIKAVESESPDIVILDINLPDMTGFEVLERIRSFSDVPIIVLTIRDDEVDELRGLEMGADDYIVKPFSPVNLLTRVKVVLRRAGVRRAEKELPPLAIGNITINFSRKEVFVGDRRVRLTPNEGKILYYLAQNGGKLVTQEEIKQQVWGSEAEYIDNSGLKRYIYQLRTKLGDNAESPQIILNERGIGYRLSIPENITTDYIHH
jgi:two-component system KDP operon response regulator KdpE